MGATYHRAVEASLRRQEVFFAVSGRRHDLEAGDAQLYSVPSNDIMLDVLVRTSQNGGAPCCFQECKCPPLANSVAIDRKARKRGAEPENSSCGGRVAQQKQEIGLEAFLRDPCCLRVNRLLCEFTSFLGHETPQVRLGARLCLSTKGDELEAFLRGPHCVIACDSVQECAGHTRARDSFGEEFA